MRNKIVTAVEHFNLARNPELGKNYGFEDIHYHKNDNTQTEVSLMRKGKDLYIFFESTTGGTDALVINPEWLRKFLNKITFNSLDWFHNFLFGKKVVPYEGTNKEIKIHSGFYLKYFSVRDWIHNEIKHHYLKDGVGNIVVSGHSQGGSLSTVCSVDLQYNFDIPDNNIFCISIAGARVGNKHFKDSYNMRVPFSVILKYGWDIVPNLPPKIFGYRHVGNKIYFKRTEKFLWKRFFQYFIYDHYPHKYQEAIKNYYEGDNNGIEGND